LVGLSRIGCLQLWQIARTLPEAEIVLVLSADKAMIDNEASPCHTDENSIDPSRTLLLTWILIWRPLVTCTRWLGARKILSDVIMLPTLGPVNRVRMQRAS
jgi:hypothetical protein